MTEGIISGMNRDVTIRNFNETMLQISAAVSPGNSGGPVLNMFGEVVGIVTAKSRADDTEGIGFAIPSNTVKLLVDDINAGISGSLTLGIMVQTVSAETAEERNLPMGLQITTVNPGSNAARAGLRVNDIMTAFNGNSIRTFDDLHRHLTATKSGDTVRITVSRPISNTRREMMTLTVRVIIPQPMAA
jgi:serine protease Do